MYSNLATVEQQKCDVRANKTCNLATVSVSRSVMLEKTRHV